MKLEMIKYDAGFIYTLSISAPYSRTPSAIRTEMAPIKSRPKLAATDGENNRQRHRCASDTTFAVDTEEKLLCHSKNMISCKYLRSR